MNRLRPKCVTIVTGASRGVGRATALELARRGHCVVGTYRTGANEAERLRHQAEREGLEVHVRKCDTTKESDVRSLLAHSTQLGELDAVVANAGIWDGGLIEDISSVRWRRVIDVDLVATADLLRAALPIMRQRGYGRMVVVSSIVGITGYAGDTAYSAAKAGLHGLVRSLAKEVARHGISVNALAPGPIATDMTAGLPSGAYERLIDGIPLGRSATPEEVAEVLAWMAEAPTYMTGAIIPMAGGMT